MKNKYRIKEFDGKFEIQIFVVEEKKRFLRKTIKKECWKSASSDGTIYYNIVSRFGNIKNEKCKTFFNLQDAKDKIKSWKKGNIYHY